MSEKRGWAVVTGASSGLGVEFARQLAAKGYDLVLVARRRDRLDEVAAGAKKAHGVDTLVLDRDLQIPGAGAALDAELAERSIVPAVLVNNAGFGLHGDATDIPVERTLGMVQLNVTTLTELTLRIGKRMVARGGGGILNVSSIGAYQPTPYFSAYAATKAYVLSFSMALAQEFGPRGVTVLAHCPGPTTTEFMEVADVKGGFPSFLFMTAERCVRIGLRALESGRSVVVTGWLNVIQSMLSRLTPLRLITWITGIIMRPPAPKALPPGR